MKVGTPMKECEPPELPPLGGCTFEIATRTYYFINDGGFTNLHRCKKTHARGEEDHRCSCGMTWSGFPYVPFEGWERPSWWVWVGASVFGFCMLMLVGVFMAFGLL